MGPAGPVGGVSGVSFESGTPSSTGSGSKTVTASCPSGKLAVAGGHLIEMLSGGGSEPPFILESRLTAPDTWTIATRAGVITSNYRVTAYAVCIDG
jgi:hypothetical protein